VAELQLVEFDRARLAIEAATSIDEVKEIRDQAEALRLYMRQSQQGLEMQNQCAEIKLRAERRAGEMLADGLQHQGGRPKPLHDERVLLRDHQISEIQSHRWQQVAQVPEEAFDAYIAATRDSDTAELTTAGLLRRPDAALRSSEAVEWYTPPQYIAAVREVLGGIDLDPASSLQANKVVKAKQFCGKDSDGLTCDWPGRVFLNPPYGGASAAFATKLVQQYEAGPTSAAILLVNANSTDAGWFQPLWAYTLCFTNHRIDFVSPAGEGSGSTHGSAFVYFGEDASIFGQVFRRFGPIVQVIMEAKDG